MLRVAPDEVRGSAVGIHHVDLAAVDIDRQRPRAEATLVSGIAPAVEEEEAGAVGVAEQVVEPMDRTWLEGDVRRAGERDLRRLGEREE